MQKAIILFILLFLPLISGVCNETQIDINKGSLEELDELSGIGPVKAQEIINSRPFKTLNHLINVSGIGEVTLEKIIEQGLACIENIQEENDFTKQEEGPALETISPPVSSPLKKEKIINVSSISEPVIRETIQLNPKTIKTENSKEIVEEKNYAKYSIIIFCILLLSLYTIKPRKKKNEWQ